MQTLISADAIATRVAAMAADIVTGPVDKAAFQALINGSAPGDRILCQAGEYDFRPRPGGGQQAQGENAGRGQQAEPGRCSVFRL